MNKNNSREINSFIRQFIALSCFFAIITVILSYSASVITSEPEIDTSAQPSRKNFITVIDPGHGGEDGGAVAVDGTVEKDLNLDFSKNIYNICNLLGINAVLTRDTDTLLYDKYSDLEDYTGKKKVYDLKNRLRFAKEAGENPIFVSIHMNKFTDSKYSGTQIYYSSNSTKSEELAATVRSKISDVIQPQNKREIKKAGTSIFLLKQIQCPAILIECGFLSNETETTMLKSTEYKKEFSLTTAVAIGEFIDSDL